MDEQIRPEELEVQELQTSASEETETAEPAEMTEVAEPAEETAKPEETPKTQQKDFARQTVLRLFCGGYLVYLAGKLVMGIINGETVLEWALLPVVLVLGIILFAVVGTLLLVSTIKKLIAEYRPKD